MNTDPISDLLTRVRNATSAKKKSLSLPHSQVKEGIAKILEDQQMIEKARVDRTGKFPEIIITLLEDSPLLSLKRISKPGRRVYISSQDIREIRSGYGISIISTSSGLMTGADAKKKNMGGEVLCEVY